MLQVLDVQKAFAGKHVLRGLALEVAEGEIVALLGASGSGKSTLLRLIAGLEAPDAGDIRLRGRSILATPAHARGFGLMFQDFALFPHLNVADNVAFGLKMRGVGRVDARAQASAALARVGLVGFETRDTAGLSGGEKQRVALARSLAPRPHLLMLDEPLASLDAALRERLVEDVRTIIRGAGLTALYVTHDQREAYTVADRLGVLHDGRLAQLDTPQAVYRRPVSAFVARFLGLENIAAAPVWRAAGVPVPAAAGGDVLLHPDGITLTAAGIPAVITAARFAGPLTELDAQLAAGPTLAFRTPSLGAPASGKAVCVTVDPAAIISLSPPPAAP